MRPRSNDTDHVSPLSKYRYTMSCIPVIHIEPTNADNDEGVLQTVQPHPGWLSVPDMNYTDNVSLDASTFYGLQEDQQDLRSNGPTSDTLYITTITKDKKTSLKRELVWVQIYQRISSIGSRLNTCQREITTYLMFYSFTPGGTPTKCAPELCSPLICLNLKHSKMVPLDSKRFNIITRNGECCFVQAEIPPNTDMNYWMELLQPNGDRNARRRCSSEYVPIIRSAPGSPEPRRKQPCGLNETGPIFCLGGSSDPLNDIEEAENE